jgi:hypothetical protein
MLNAFKTKKILAVLCVGLFSFISGCNDSKTGQKSKPAGKTQPDATVLSSPLVLTTSTAAAPAGQVVFPLQYTSWKNSNAGLSIGAHDVKIQDSPQTPFTKSLHLDAANVVYSELPCLPDSPQTAIVHDPQGKETALYIDLNGNGKLDEGETIFPTEKTKMIAAASGVTSFATPDFEIRRDGKRIPYRMEAEYFENNGKPVVSWMILCAMGSSATVEGIKRDLQLYDSGLGVGNYREACRITGGGNGLNRFKMICLDKKYFYDVSFSPDQENRGQDRI